MKPKIQMCSPSFPNEIAQVAMIKLQIQGIRVWLILDLVWSWYSSLFSKPNFANSLLVNFQRILCKLCLKFGGIKWFSKPNHTIVVHVKY
jgi:hypothetical protein